MKKFLKLVALLIMIIPFCVGAVTTEEKNFCDKAEGGQGEGGYYFHCNKVATQCTYKKSSDGSSVAYIDINNEGDAKAGQGIGFGNDIKNWLELADGIPAIPTSYVENRDCPPILIENYGFYVVEEKNLRNFERKFPDAKSYYRLESVSKNTNISKKTSGTPENANYPDVDSCAGFNNPAVYPSGVDGTDVNQRKKYCTIGITANNGNFGCAWNKQYNFCSPNGLAYLSCGDPSKDTDAHDIPVMVPRLIAYFIVILKTATPIVLIIMGMVQIIKAIANTNEDEIKKAKSSLIKKLIAAALVFFSISIVQFVVDQVVDDDEKGSMAACMNCFINNECNGSTYFVDGYGKCYYLSDKDNGVDCKTDIGGKVNNQFLKNHN